MSEPRSPRMCLLIALCVAIVVWSVDLTAWLITAEIAPLLCFGYQGTALAPALAYYLTNALDR